MKVEKQSVSGRYTAESAVGHADEGLGQASARIGVCTDEGSAPSSACWLERALLVNAKMLAGAACDVEGDAVGRNVGVSGE